MCVVYPKKNYFTVLVVVGNKEKEDVENLLPRLSEYYRKFIVTLEREMDKGGL